MLSSWFPSLVSLKLPWDFSSNVISDDILRFSSCPMLKEAVLLIFSLLIHPLVYTLSVFPCAGVGVSLVPC